MRICTIIGARPQFIKAAAVSRAIAAHNRNMPAAHINEIIIHTGQHYDDGMSAIFFRELEIPKPKYNLNIGSGSHGSQTGRMLAAIEEVLLKEKPDWVLIYGDTNSTLAGALAAAKLHIPIAHVEAGLRSFNRRMPEEVNRVIADQMSQLLFCPSQTAVNNLAAEGIPPNTPNPLVRQVENERSEVRNVSRSETPIPKVNRIGIGKLNYPIRDLSRLGTIPEAKRSGAGHV